jgi:hypothetical protein
MIFLDDPLETDLLRLLLDFGQLHELFLFCFHCRWMVFQIFQPLEPCYWFWSCTLSECVSPFCNIGRWKLVCPCFYFRFLSDGLHCHFRFHFFGIGVLIWKVVARSELLLIWQIVSSSRSSKSSRPWSSILASSEILVSCLNDLLGFHDLLNGGLESGGLGIHDSNPSVHLSFHWESKLWRTYPTFLWWIFGEPFLSVLEWVPQMRHLGQLHLAVDSVWKCHRSLMVPIFSYWSLVTLWVIV